MKRKMFQLVKILSGRGNESEARHIAVNALSDGIAKGTPVSISAGSVTPLGAETTVRATHIVERDTEAGATRLYVTDLLPGMVFETRLTDSPVGMGIGGEYKLGTGGLSATVVSGAVRGAILYDATGAHAAGDSVYVTFPQA